MLRSKTGTHWFFMLALAGMSHLHGNRRKDDHGKALYALPPYSPELNRIEHRWKHIKYSELPAAAWKNLTSLVDKLTNAFAKLGRFVLMPSLASG